MYTAPSLQVTLSEGTVTKHKNNTDTYKLTIF